MGKQSQARRERKQRRDRSRNVDAATLELWSRIPDGALSGPCNRPQCALVHCLDSWVTQLALHNDLHDGPLVLVNYAVYGPDVTQGPEHRVRINGQDFATLPMGALFREDPEEHGRRMEVLRARLLALFGAGADLAFFEHVTRSPQVLEKQAKSSTPPVQA